jgi:hypothetical protein
MDACPRDETGMLNCPGHCACIDAPGYAGPCRFISGAAEPERAGGYGGLEGLAWNARVDFCARDLPLVTLAAVFDRSFPGEVCVPAGRVYATVSKKLTQASLSEVAHALGLIVLAKEERTA